MHTLLVRCVLQPGQEQGESVHELINLIDGIADVRFSES
jgi:hypothetical protein